MKVYYTNETIGEFILRIAVKSLTLFTIILLI